MRKQPIGRDCGALSPPFFFKPSVEQRGSNVIGLPISLTIIFAAIYMYDKARGGYQEEVLVQHQDEATQAA